MKRWPNVSLGELIRLERRKVRVISDQQYQEIGIYCFGRGIFHKVPRSGMDVGDKDLFQICDGDLILQITFAWEGAIALCGKNEDGLYGSTRYPTFRVNEDRCYPSYLLQYLCTSCGLEQINRICPGSAGRNRVLSLKRIHEIMIPLPPLSEQQRIISRVDKLFAMISEAKSLRDQCVANVQALCRSIIVRDQHAKMTPMRDLVNLRPPDIEVQASQSYQFAGVYSFGKGVFRAQNKSGMEFAYKRLTRLKAGNFVYPKLMAWEGALGIVPSECDGCVVSTEFPVFVVQEDKVFPEVLDIYFRMPEVWPMLSASSSGTNVRRRRLNPQNFLNYKMPLPSRETQVKLRMVYEKVKELSALQSKTAAELDALLPSILNKAFNGEL